MTDYTKDDLIKRINHLEWLNESQEKEIVHLKLKIENLSNLNKNVK